MFECSLIRDGATAWTELGLNETAVVRGAPFTLIDVELRNGTTANGVALAGTGWNGVTLVLEDGTVLSARSDAPELRDTPVNQGANLTATLVFETPSTSKPSRIILRLDPKGTENTGLSYKVANPTFRVDVSGLVR